MKLYRDQGIVLRTHKLGEADRIITLLTRTHGKVRAVAKGVRRTKSRFGARLEPFSHVDAQFYRGRTLDIVTQVESVHAYGREISADYERYTAGAVIVETADKLVWDEGIPDIQQYLLLHGALHSLANNEHRPELIATAYLLRAFAYAGFELATRDCASCGKLGPHSALSIPAGGTVCTDCRPPGASMPDRESVVLLGSMLAGEWEGADEQPERIRNEATALASAHAQWHLEHKIKSLSLLT